MTNALEYTEGIDAAVTVVLLHEDPISGEILPVEGNTPVDLAEGTPPAPELVAQLLDSSVRLTAPDVPREIVEAVTELPVPANFAESPWLRAHRVLTLRGNRAALGSFRMYYSPRLGLVVDELPRTDTGE
ncbi:hypothetical protein ACFHYQ_08730 [Sphaerimonospora cavernae]|uniref:Cas3 C-terminal domain-containing protein n=1 Tax=Sphaerimonospora cavernae TaxID=1740611 RepID=A0ABV6U1R2_9ACTN